MNEKVEVNAPQQNASALAGILLSKVRRNKAEELLKAFAHIAEDVELPIMLMPIADEFADALSEAPDVAMALVNFRRLCDVVGKTHLLKWLSEDKGMLHALLKILGTSNYAADTLHLHPEYLSTLSPLRKLGEPKGFYALMNEAKGATRAFREMKRKWGSLRRFRQKETLRIITADVLGMMSYENVVAELSDLAEAVVRTALDLAIEQIGLSSTQERCGFLVIALGKLGGLELNYSSDIDLMFTFDEDMLLRNVPDAKTDGRRKGELASQIATKLASALTSGLSDVTEYGYAYRVDLRLRPYGQSGPMVLRWDAMISYYESWARSWERMALLKARPIAGDVALAMRFLRFVDSYVYTTPIESDSISALVEVKKHSEELAEATASLGHVKAGRGGIRDVEFVVQLLQLLFGGKCESLRTPNTMRAIEALFDCGLLTHEECEELREGYIFLRKLEHMLQIVEHLPIRELPKKADELEKLARRMGFDDADSLLSTYRMHTRNVRSIYERVLRDIESIFSKVEEESVLQSIYEGDYERIIDWLSRCGFKKPKEVLKVLRLLTDGPASVPLSFRERIAMMHLLPKVMEVASKTVNPDTAIMRLEQIATAFGNRAAFISSLCSNDLALEMLLKCIAFSGYLTELMMRYPEYVEVVLREPLSDVGSLSAISAELMDRAVNAKTDEETKRLIRRFKHREVLRIGFSELNGLLKSNLATTMLSDVADACVEAALRRSIALIVGEPIKMVAIGFGGLGARELHYASDLDLAFAHDAEHAVASQVATHMIHLLSEITDDNFAYKVDVRLRPQPSGTLSWSAKAWLSALKEIEAWQFLSFPRMRAVAGDIEMALKIINTAWDEMVRQFSNTSVLSELLRLWHKAKEEHKPPSDVLDPKYAFGGLVDIQFAVTLIQLAYGSKENSLRHYSYSHAIKTATQLSLLPENDARALLEGHEFMRMMKALITLIKSPQVTHISLNEAEFEQLAMQVTGEASPEVAVREVMQRWERTTQRACEAVTRTIEHVAKMVA